MPVDDDNKIDISTSSRFFKSGESITLTWSPTSVIQSETSIDTSTLKVSIRMYEIQNQESVATVETIKEVAVLTTDAPNNGEATVTIPSSLPEATTGPICSIAIFVEIRDSEETTIISKFDGKIGLWARVVWAVIQAPDLVDDYLYKKCLQWAQEEPTSIGDELLDRVSDTPCPPNVGQARTVNSGLVKDEHTSLINFFHPEASECFRQRTITVYVTISMTIFIYVLYFSIELIRDQEINVVIAHLVLSLWVHQVEEVSIRCHQQAKDLIISLVYGGTTKKMYYHFSSVVKVERNHVRFIMTEGHQMMVHAIGPLFQVS